MKFQIKFFTSIILALIVLTGWITPAYADPLINSVTPNLVFNDTATTITVTGAGFVSGATVSLKNYGALTTSFDSPAQLRAVVRPGVPSGTYTVVVTNPDSTIFEYPNGLTIADPSPLPTATAIPFNRPQMVVSSYEINQSRARANDDFKLSIDFANAGTTNALNVQAVFTSPDLAPIETGGVIAVDTNLLPGNHSDAVQNFYVLDSVFGKSVITIEATLTYYDSEGTVYTDKFTLSVPAESGTGSAYPTATPTGVNSAQLVITSYASTVDPLQPGAQFQLGLTVQNMGNTPAKSVTMIMGGGSAGGNDGGTPQPGGVSGSSGEFTNFAPLNSSNIQSLGDIPAGGAMQVLQDLIVNVSTDPGAYPMKISFSYVNNKGEVINDDQVITLLVYRLPNVDVSFYRPLDPMFTGQPGALPIQIVNLGKSSTVLGNMKIAVEGGTIDPATTLVGSLDPGGYFTFDSTLFPDVPGPMELNVTIEYTDDFNQPRTLTRKLEVTVEEMVIDPSTDPSMGGGGGEMPPMEEESFFHKVWRAILGFFGLDSAPPTNEIPGGEMMPGEEMIPIPSNGGKGG